MLVAVIAEEEIDVHEVVGPHGPRPADRLLVETDIPFLAPETHRGRRNEPANVVHTARCLAIARGVPLERLAHETTANARRVFLRR